MKNIIAIVIVISALAIFLSKKLELYSSWRKTSAKIISINKILDGKNKIEMRYSYQVAKNKYEGMYIINKSKINENDKISIYYHWLNPELSVRNIPTNFEDILLLLVSLIGGLYLYFYSCENCEVIPTISNSIPVVNN